MVYNHIPRTVKVWYNHTETMMGRYDLLNEKVICVDVYGTNVNRPDEILLAREVVLLSDDDPLSERFAILRKRISVAKAKYDRGNKKFYGYY